VCVREREREREREKERDFAFIKVHAHRFSCRGCKLASLKKTHGEGIYLHIWC
jgi:hypothetical protein